MTKEESKQFHLAQASWWTAYAQTGIASKRKMQIQKDIGCGFVFVEMTNEEKIEEAFNTAKSHLESFYHICND